MRQHWRAALLAFLAYSAIAVAYTWPLSIRLNGVPHDLGDPLLTTWFLWWSGHTLPLTSAWWNVPAFYPAPGIFGFSEHLLGLLPIAGPLNALTGQPLVGHNVAFIATFVLSALGAHYLAYTLTRRHDVSIVAAVAFAFAPYRLPQTPHIQVLASHWTPICLAALHRYDADPRWRWAVAAAAAWVLQALSCGYYLFFLAVLVAFWMLWFAVGRWPVRQLLRVVATFAGGALLLVPILRGYQRILQETYGFFRGIGEIRSFSADIASLLSASEDLLVWGWVRVFERPEANLFPGLTIVLLTALAVWGGDRRGSGPADSRIIRLTRRILAGLLALLLVASALPMLYGSWQLTVAGTRLVSIARADKPLTLALVAALGLLALLPGLRAAFNRRSAVAFYLLAAFATWMLTLGPDPTFMGLRAFYRAPYGPLMELPGFGGLRVPARFWMMTLACLSVAGALAVHRLSGPARRVVIALAVTGLLLDGWPRRFPVLAAPPLRPSPPGSFARLDLPATDFGDATALYQQMFDPIPLYNGFSGHRPPHYDAMRAMLDAGDSRVLLLLAERGPLGVVVDHAGDGDGAFRKMILATPGVATERVEPGWSSYRVPRSSNVPLVPEESGQPLRIKSVTASRGAAPPERAIDGRLETLWDGGPQRAPASFTIELDQPSRISQVVILLGPLAAAFPAQLELSVSSDGSQWETVYRGSAALQAYYGALRHPKRVPLVFPVERDGVRFVRLEQTGISKHDWWIAELEVRR